MKCSIEVCNRLTQITNLCSAHYQQKNYYGFIKYPILKPFRSRQVFKRKSKEKK